MIVPYRKSGLTLAQYRKYIDEIKRRRNKLIDERIEKMRKRNQKKREGY